MKKKKPDATAKAFHSSAGGTFAGVKLHPVTKQREAVAYEMGMKLGFVNPYRASYFFRDTIIWLWLRTIPVTEPKRGIEWSVDAAEIDPDSAMKGAYAWAEKIKLAARTPLFMEAQTIFMKDQKELAESKGDPVIPEDKQGGGGDSGEL